MKTISGPQRYAKGLAETGQRVQLIRQPSRTEKLLWAAALAPDDAEAQALFAKARELAAKERPSVRMPAISTADSFRAFFPVSPHDQLRNLVRYGRVGRAGRDRAWAGQEERERVPLLEGERGRCLGHFPDPSIQVAARMVCGVPVRVVALVTLGPAAGARPGCRPGSGLPPRR